MGEKTELVKKMKATFKQYPKAKVQILEYEQGPRQSEYQRNLGTPRSTRHTGIRQNLYQSSQ